MKPLAAPTQDMVIGLNYLTRVKPKAKGQGKRFSSIDEARLAYESGYIDLNAEIEVKINGEMIKTTMGRIVFNEKLPKELGFVNREMDKKSLSTLVWKVHVELGSGPATELLDSLKELGFYYATISGLTFGIDDMVVPPEKEEIIRRALEERKQIEKAYQKGLLSRSERYQKILCQRIQLKL
jgi:DNA-directed RNA polymerase subunit beta'